MTLQGTITRGAILLDDPLQLPEGTRVEIVVQVLPNAAPEKEPTLSERPLKHAGTLTDLASDMAEQHDHYIHGTPKR